MLPFLNLHLRNFFFIMFFYSVDEYYQQNYNDYGVNKTI